MNCGVLALASQLSDEEPMIIKRTNQRMLTDRGDPTEAPTRWTASELLGAKPDLLVASSSYRHRGSLILLTWRRWIGVRGDSCLQWAVSWSLRAWLKDLLSMLQPIEEALGLIVDSERHS